MDKNPVSVLYVDDEEVLLDLTQKFLERMDAFSVRKASSVSEALTLLQSFPCDVIVSDYQMPETDGIEFLKKVKRNYPDLPFILFTGRGREEIVIQAINNGAAFYIQKGGDPTAQFTELAHKIRQAVAQTRAEKALMRNFVALQQQEQVIKEREKFFQAIFENTGTAMMVIENDTTISFGNAECERLSGYSRREIEGKMSWMEFIAEEDRQQMLAWHHQRRMAGNNVPLTYEFTLITRNGNRRRIYMNADLIPGTKKSIVSLLDITDRIAAEEALRKSEALHRAIFDISPDPIVLTDERGVLMHVSPSSLRLFGLDSKDEAVGTSLFAWIAPEKRDEVEGRVLRFIWNKSPSTSATLFPLIKKNGKRFFAEISSAVLAGSDGRPCGMVSVLRDVTGRINAEKDLRKPDAE